MANEDTITIDSSALSDSDVYLDIDSMSTYTYNVNNAGAIGSSASIYTTSGMNGTSGAYLTANTAYGTSWVTNNTSPFSIGSSTLSNPSTMKVTGNAEFEGSVMINGQNISEFMETISKRLAILVPDPAKLEHFEALKKAYEHYKILEALCEVPKEEITD
jgi:hypothetical protein